MTEGAKGAEGGALDLARLTRRDKKRIDSHSVVVGEAVSKGAR